jgi:hypothetical protein
VTAQLLAIMPLLSRLHPAIEAADGFTLPPLCFLAIPSIQRKRENFVFSMRKTSSLFDIKT